MDNNNGDVNIDNEAKVVDEKELEEEVVTAALPYLNNVPHPGTLVGSILPADVYTRYLRSGIDPTNDKKKVTLVGGGDEYGTATETMSLKLGMTCKELCDMNYRVHKDIYDWFNVKFDCFGRTSQPNGTPAVVDMSWPQTSITHEIFKSLCDNGYIIEQEEQVMYCPELNKFVVDRYVTGTCRFCKSTSANGDQCDCGKLLALSDIIDPRYKPNPLYKLEIRTTENLYLDVNKVWQDHKMKEWFESVAPYNNWTKNATSTTQQWLDIGIKPRSITRDLSWGTAVPDTPQFGSKYNNKVFYVWFDAPIGYISITEKALGKEQSEKLWKNPKTKFTQFMAKDNVIFHSIIFPTTVRGANYGTLENLTIASCDYLMYEGQKFSKTEGTGIFCDDIIKLSAQYNLSPDYWRAYLIFIRPESDDSNFVLNGNNGFVGFINNILIANIGNLLHRVLSIAFQIYNKHKIDTLISTIIKVVDNELLALEKSYITDMNQFKFSSALRTVFTFSSCLNNRVQQTKPWALIKDDSQKETLYKFMIELYQDINHMSRLLEPFMPTFSCKIRDDFKLTVNENEGLTVLNLPLPQIKPVVLINPVEELPFTPKSSHK
jgi:methionyl-tRNA synthetase